MSKKKFQILDLTEVKPSGWLKEQLQVQALGLSGILYDVWDSVGSYNGWLGGTGDNWERAPYFLDGILPLAYYLGDKKLWETAQKYIDWILNSQDEEGNFGPQETKDDWWSRMVALKALIQYYEITKEERKRVVQILKKFEVTIKKTRPIDEGIITSGGIQISQINPTTMESKIISNLCPKEKNGMNYFKSFHLCILQSTIMIGESWKNIQKMNC